jgi:DNA-binding transcriptional LysR family regulator
VIGGEITRLLKERAPHTVLRLRTTSVDSAAVFAEDAADVALLPEAFATQLPRERLYDDRWVVVASWNEPRDAGALELLETVPHVVSDAAPQRVLPYEVLDEHGVSYTVGQRVSDYLFVPHLIARAGGVALHRYQVGIAFEGRFDLRMEEFPFPIPSLGIDMVWNPWLTDDPFRAWLRDLLIEAAEPIVGRYRPGPRAVA